VAALEQVMTLVTSFTPVYTVERIPCFHFTEEKAGAQKGKGHTPQQRRSWSLLESFPLPVSTDTIALA
jgi:hypothetical protein